MRIDNQYISSLQKAYDRQKNTAAERSKQETPNDGVRISSEARLWNTGMQALRELPEEKEEAQIEKLKISIKNGTYHVSSEEIAKRML